VSRAISSNGRIDETAVVAEPGVGAAAREAGATSAGGHAGLPDGAAVVLRGYGRRFGERTVLDGIDLTLDEGQLVALLGASGSGKSTLLRALAGLDAGASGEVIVPRQRTVVFQDHRLLPWKKVWRNVVIGLPRAGRGGSRASGGDPASAPGAVASRATAVAALEEVGLAARADAWPATLSGGESQRVALARAFVRSPQLLLLDEPFGALDALTRIRMHALLRDLVARHRPTTLIVTHDVDEALALADRVLVVADKRIAFDQRVALSPAERVGDPSTAALRGELLAQLGVGAELRAGG
jgi:sulfonate transport system ATP-binding protein